MTHIETTENVSLFIADEKLTAFMELESVATTRARTFNGLSVLY